VSHGTSQLTVSRNILGKGTEHSTGPMHTKTGTGKGTENCKVIREHGTGFRNREQALHRANEHGTRNGKEIRE